jgi:hypothetical protein
MALKTPSWVRRGREWGPDLCIGVLLLALIDLLQSPLVSPLANSKESPPPGAEEACALFRSDQDLFAARARQHTLKHAAPEHSGEVPGIWAKGGGFSEAISSLSQLPTRALHKALTRGGDSGGAAATHVVTFTTDAPGESFAVSLQHDQTFSMASRYEVEAMADSLHSPGHTLRSRPGTANPLSRPQGGPQGPTQSPWTLASVEAERDFLGV